MRARIVILNLKDYSFTVPNVTSMEAALRVDRATCLGNPFEMQNESDEERNRVCDQYEVWFREQLAKSTPNIMRRLSQIEKSVATKNTVYLCCWCYPKRCHSETIKAYLEGQL